MRWTTMGFATPIQRIEFEEDKVANLRDTANRIYLADLDGSSAPSIDNPPLTERVEELFSKASRSLG